MVMVIKVMVMVRICLKIILITASQRSLGQDGWEKFACLTIACSGNAVNREIHFFTFLVTKLINEQVRYKAASARGAEKKICQFQRHS